MGKFVRPDVIDVIIDMNAIVGIDEDVLYNPYIYESNNSLGFNSSCSSPSSISIIAFISSAQLVPPASSPSHFVQLFKVVKSLSFNSGATFGISTFTIAKAHVLDMMGWLSPSTLFPSPHHLPNASNADFNFPSSATFRASSFSFLAFSASSFVRQSVSNTTRLFATHTPTRNKLPALLTPPFSSSAWIAASSFSGRG